MLFLPHQQSDPEIPAKVCFFNTLRDTLTRRRVPGSLKNQKYIKHETVLALSAKLPILG
jgi:hypothetical protein